MTIQAARFRGGPPRFWESAGTSVPDLAWDAAGRIPAKRDAEALSMPEARSSWRDHPAIFLVGVVISALRCLAPSPAVPWHAAFRRLH